MGKIEAETRRRGIRRVFFIPSIWHVACVIISGISILLMEKNPANQLTWKKKHHLRRVSYM